MKTVTTIKDIMQKMQQGRYQKYLLTLTPEKQLQALNSYSQLEKYLEDNKIEFVDWDKYPEQTEAINKIVDRVKTKKGQKIVVIFGANRSGKTQAGAMAVTRIATEIPKSRILCATIESKISINVQQKAIYEWMPKRRVSVDSDYNPSRGWKNGIVQIDNDSICLIKTYAQGYEAFQGDQFDVVWLDEESQYNIFQECLMRTTDRDGVIFFTFTSLQGFTRLVNRLWESSDPEVWTTILTLDMNPYICGKSKEIIKNTVDDDEKASRIYGKPHLKEGLIYKEFGKIHKLERFPYEEYLRGDPRRWEIHEGIDPHSRTPHHWLRFLFDRVYNVLYVVEELKAPKECMLIEDFSRMIKSKRIRAKGSSGYIMPKYTQIDTSSMTPEVTHVHNEESQEDIHTVRLAFFKAGVQTILCTKDNNIGINAVKSRLKVVRTAEGVVKRNPRIYVFDDLRGVNWEFMRYSWGAFSSSKISEKKEMINSPLKKDDHYMDIIKYECIKLMADYGNHEERYPQDVARYPDIGY